MSKVDYSRFGGYNYTIECAGSQLHTAKKLFIKAGHYEVDLFDEINEVIDQAIETICGTNSRAEEFIEAYLFDKIDLTTAIEYLTTHEEELHKIEGIS